MFTGIIEQTAVIKSIAGRGGARRLGVYFAKNPEAVKIGDSISINGVCLTITGVEKKYLSFDITEETFKNTTFRRAKINDVVNVERSRAWNDRVEGHFVLGHVDGSRKIKSMIMGHSPYMDLAILPADRLYLAKKGSIAVDGISLTVGSIDESAVRVFLIPLTIRATNLKYKKTGDEVNIEFDILAKYTHNRLLYGKNSAGAVTESVLKNNGFI